MTTLSALLKDVQIAIEKHGPDSPCWYSLWTVESFQSEKQEDHDFYMEEYKRNPQENYNPGEYKPWTDKEIIFIAEHMMNNYNPAKESIAYREASNVL